MDFRCTFLVVTSGKPSARSKRIWWPNTLLVPVPVWSALATPCVSTRRMKSSYWRRMGRSGMEGLSGGFEVELHRRQPGVEPAARHQLGMAPGLDDAAMVE